MQEGHAGGELRLTKTSVHSVRCSMGRKGLVVTRPSRKTEQWSRDRDEGGERAEVGRGPQIGARDPTATSKQKRMIRISARLLCEKAAKMPRETRPNRGTSKKSKTLSHDRSRARQFERVRTEVSRVSSNMSSPLADHSEISSDVLAEQLNVQCEARSWVAGIGSASDRASVVHKEG